MLLMANVGNAFASPLQPNFRNFLSKLIFFLACPSLIFVEYSNLQKQYTMLDSTIATLQMFCLWKSQMFVCNLNPKTNTCHFDSYFCVIDYNYIHVVFKIDQQLTLLRKSYKYLFLNLVDIFHIFQIFSVFCWVFQLLQIINFCSFNIF